jgi:hypothetical protein
MHAKFAYSIPKDSAWSVFCEVDFIYCSIRCSSSYLNMNSVSDVLCNLVIVARYSYSTNLDFVWSAACMHAKSRSFIPYSIPKKQRLSVFFVKWTLFIVVFVGHHFDSVSDVLCKLLPIMMRNCWMQLIGPTHSCIFCWTNQICPRVCWTNRLGAFNFWL